MSDASTALPPIPADVDFGSVGAFIEVAAGRAICIPLMASGAAAGFPSPADDYLDHPLDFNDLLIENPASTFAVRIDGDSMIDAGIFPNDIAVVNRAREAVDKAVVHA